jgi:hypothetical protein
LWARAEFAGGERKPDVSFPHNLRFLYPTSGVQERLAQMFVLVFTIYFFLVILRFNQLLSIALPLVPTEDQEAFLAGFLSSPVVDLIFAAVVPLYASYRLGLLRYLIDRDCVSKTIERAEGRTSGSDIPHHATISS